MPNWENVPVDNGHYHVLKKLAQGGCGDVYLAHDGKLQRDVALKAPWTCWLEEPDFAKRYRRELQALVNLRHPHTVPISPLHRVAFHGP